MFRYAKEVIYSYYCTYADERGLGAGGACGCYRHHDLYALIAG